MKLNKYTFFAFIYFFLNSVGLPAGLTYTAILSPLFYWWVLTVRRREILLPFFLLLSPFVLLHISTGADPKTYIISLLNITMVYIFCQTVYTFLKIQKNLEQIFRSILIVNFILCLIAIPFYKTSYYGLFWIEQFLTEGVDNFRRLRMFTYEASYYATLFVPVFFFFFLQIIFRQNRINTWLLMLMLALPYILSFSMGVIGAMVFAVFIIFSLYLGSLARKRRVITLAIYSMTGLAALLVVLTLFFPGNALFSRIENILAGQDLSGQGRTTDAFILAKRLLALKNECWGIGFGQVKMIGEDIIRGYYGYPPDYNVISIPNATAETLAILGWIGVSIRILAELALFCFTRVWTNYYRLLLFSFVFLYQFTGSFVTNIAEYVIWILAFTNSFPQFNVVRNFSIKPAPKQVPSQDALSNERS
ncbi:hypothetical protein D3H65_27395 [Paraflavitalea soli]|uniref:O-antigen ligase domain-containing protein n=1 Tax=Paraflavitalea soli TaxID=2315862 RepID=A0A3B7N5Z5_9BACT|nr:hypothetical protein [Paraflavitalea soli]AXY77481.1 hypothetical protein D3H65_27395 [Paraflavitalea soli]